MTEKVFSEVPGQVGPNPTVPGRRSFASLWLTTESLAQVAARYRGIGPGFDFLRLGLSMLIFYAHTRYALTIFAAPVGDTGADIAALAPGLTESRSMVETISQLKSRVYVLYVPLFFTLSGFLVTGSAFRTRRVWPFLRLRALRIFPALTVETILCAVVLGLTFTTLTPGAYLTDPGFYRYMGNILGFVSFHLPGVFETNPVRGMVNVNLWTLPAEFYCYLLLSGLIAVGVLLQTRILMILFGGLTIAFVVASVGYGLGLTNSVYATPVVVYYFLFGVVFFIGRDFVPMNPLIFLACIAVTLSLVMNPVYTLIIPVFLTYVMVYIGHMPWLRLPFLKGRDYSYGIYLYGFPITQAVVAVNPGIQRPVLLFTAFAITLLFSALSWHWIEKPILTRR